MTKALKVYRALSISKCACVNRRDRCLTAMEFEEPDVLPISEQSIDPLVRIEILSKRKGADALVTAHVKADLDAIWVGTGPPVHYKPPTWLSDRAYVDQLGRVNEIRQDIDTTWYKAGTVKSLDDWEKMRCDLDPHAPGVLDAFAETVKLASPYEMCIIGTLACGALTNAYLTCGMSTALQSFYRNPELVHKIAEDFAMSFIDVIGQMVDLGADVFCIGDDLADCNGPLVSPTMLRKYIFPLLRRVNVEVKRHGKLIFLHSDGNLYPILDDIVDAGYDGIQAIEPQAGMDIGIVKERYGDKLFLMGNVDVSHTLCFGSISDVERETREVIRKASPGGGHVLSSSNSMHNAVRVENFLAMVRTGRKYGKYGNLRT